MNAAVHMPRVKRYPASLRNQFVVEFQQLPEWVKDLIHVLCLLDLSVGVQVVWLELVVIHLFVDPLYLPLVLAWLLLRYQETRYETFGIPR